LEISEGLTMMKSNLLTRRMFLQGSGSALVAIPFLSSLLERSAHAAPLAQARYVHINSNLCLPRSLTYPLYASPWPSYPRPAGANPDSVPWTQKDADTKYQSLKDIVAYQGKLSFALDEQWNPFVNRMNVITNAHAYMADDRHNCGVSSACSNGPGPLGADDISGPLQQYGYSTDWLIEQAWSKSSPAPGPALRLNLYEQDGGYQTFCFGGASGLAKKIPMMQSLGELSLKVSASQNSNPTGPSTLNRVSRIESVLDDYKSLIGHRRISALDKQRLSDAADLWHDVDKRLQSTTTHDCSSLASSAASAPDWGARHRLALDTVAAALACGASRNVAYGLIQGGDTTNDQLTMHGWEHDPRMANEGSPSLADPYYKQLLPWRGKLITSFLAKLDSLTDETGQSLLNSSLVVWAHQYADHGHSMLGHVLVTAGGANGKLDTGWHVDAGGAPVNKFHLTNMLAMGLSLADIEKSGGPGFGEVATPIRTGDNSNAVIAVEQDAPQGNMRKYDTTKKDHFAGDAERRKPFPYLKA
jgi:hypothetical protein